MKQYKNIIFDVGEVLLSYRWKAALAEGGCSTEEANELGPKVFASKYWPQLDLGIRPYFEVAEDLASEFPEYHDVVMNFLTEVKRMPLPRPKVWAEVHRLKEKGYGIYLLSNYSEYMFTNHTEGLPFIDDISGKMVSYMININKPDQGIYEALMSKYDLKPSECIFFDDRAENIEGAKKCGIAGIVVTDEEFLLEQLKKF